MNKIKGLITKDILELRAYRRNMVLIIIIYGVLIYSNSSNSDMSGVGAVMIMMVFAILGINTFHYDDKTKTDRYLLTLPITRKDIVLSKYVLSILLTIVGAIIGIIFGFVISYMRGYKMVMIDNLMSSVVSGFLVTALVSGVQIPFIYKYGVEKGRMVIYVVAMLIFIVSNAIAIFLPSINLTFLDNHQWLIPIIIIVVTILIYYISYRIAYKIYMKKEF